MDEDQDKEIKTVEAKEGLYDIISDVPESGTSLSIIKDFDKKGIATLTIKHEKEPREEKESVKYRKSHTFYNIETFVEYIDKYKSSDTVIYYDYENSKISCVLNEEEIDGNPELLVCRIDNKSLNGEMNDIESIRDSEDFLLYIKTRKSLVANFFLHLNLMSAIEISTSVEKLDVTGKASENKYIIKTTVQGQERGEPRDLPDVLSVGFEDYSMSFNEPVLYVIEVDIYYKVAPDGNLRIHLIVSNKDLLWNELNKNFYSYIKKNSPEGCLVVIGSPDFKKQEYYNR